MKHMETVIVDAPDICSASPFSNLSQIIVTVSRQWQGSDTAQSLSFHTLTEWLFGITHRGPMRNRRTVIQLEYGSRKSMLRHCSEIIRDGKEPETVKNEPNRTRTNDLIT